MDGRQGAAGSRGAQAEVTSARPDGQALGRAPDHSSLVIESGLGQSAAVAAEQTARLEAYPFALRTAEEVDGQIAIDEEIFAEVQRGANAVSRVRRNRHALIWGRRLALDQRVVHAKPGGARAIEELSVRDPILHQVAVAERCACEGHTDDRTLVGRLQGARRWMPRRPIWDRQIVLALHKGRESCDLLALGRQATRIVAGVAAHIFRCDLDAAFADGRRPE